MWQMCVRLALFAVVFLLALPVAAHAEGFITERAWYEDKTGQMDFEAVRGQAFLPFDRTLNPPFGDGALWVRLRLDPQSHAVSDARGKSEPLILRIGLNSLDSIELFDPLDIRNTPRRVGVLHPWDAEEHLALLRAFRIPRGEVVRDVWLRIQSKGTRRVEVEVLTLVNERRSAILQQFWFIAYTTVTAVFFVYVLSQRSLLPKRLVNAFVARQLVGFAVVVNALGYFRIVLSGLEPAFWIAQLGTWLLFAFVSAAIWFDCVLLQTMHPTRFVRTLTLLWLGLVCIQLVLILVGQDQLALLVLMAMLMPVLGFLVVCLIHSGDRAGGAMSALLPRSWLLWSYAVRSVLALVPALSFLGLLKYDMAPVISFMFQHFLVGSLISAMLYVQVQRQIRSRTNTLTQLVIQRDRVLVERAHRKEHQKFLAMLAHELKTPVSAMKMLLSLRKPPSNAHTLLQRLLADINGIIERCLQALLNDDSMKSLQVQDIDVSLKLQLASARFTPCDRIKIACPSQLSWPTDPEVFQIIIANLLDNALKYSPLGSQVQLGAEIVAGPQHALRVWVENEEGPAGVPDLAQLFVKFYRNPLARRQSGSGLGLYLTNSFVKALGGSIGCQTSHGRVRFELCLPG